MTSRRTRRRILVDTSVWIAYFRDPSAPVGDRLEGLMDADEAFVAGPIVYEVLQGTRTPEEFDTLRDLLGELPFLPAHGETWIGAAGMAAGLRRRGVTLPMTDILLATLARDNQCSIWSLDPHFASIPGVRLFQAPSRKPRRRSA
ncbi:MAG TPA: PIN domain-containing protein [Candidatus Acidoferrum sp.]|nr:PIN domain-containing protein [Candidatus Acidoferrum sp.]